MGFRLGPGVGTVARLIGIWKVDAAYPPLDPGLPDARLLWVVNELAPALVRHEAPRGELTTGWAVVVRRRVMVHHAPGDHGSMASAERAGRSPPPFGTDLPI